MYDSYPESWEGMVKMGIAAQQYPLSLNWVNAKRNNNALKNLKEGDVIIASFKDHRFAGYGTLKSDFYVGGPSLRIPPLSSGELMEFHERFDCDWTIIPLDQNRPFIRCDDVKKQGFDIDMVRGQCVKQIDEDVFNAIKSRLDNSGTERIIPVLVKNNEAEMNTHAKEIVPHERKYWLWVTRPEYYLDDNGKDRADLDPNSGFDPGGWWTCHKETKKGDLVFLWRAKLKRDIGYLIQAEGAAYRFSNNDEDSNKGWKYRCSYRVLYKFENPITAKELRGDSYFKDWSPLKINFQGSFFLIQERYWNKLNQIAIRKNPDYSDIINRISSVSINATTAFNATDYVSAFHKLQIAPYHLQMLLANYYSPNRTLTATMMANAMGYDNFGAANLHYGTLGGLVGEKLGWNPLPEFKVNVLVDFKEPDESNKDLQWIMKPAVAEAIELLRWAEEQPTIPEEADEIDPIYEGAVKRISVNARVRSNTARQKCKLHYGCKCAVCGIILSEIYGEIAQGHIHFHHLRQLSEINSEYQVNPIVDLRPVCPTCHFIIHLRKPQHYSIEEVQELIKSQQERLTHLQTPGSPTDH